MMDYDRLIEQALHVIPVHRETHGIKGTFTVMRLSQTYSHWDEKVLQGALELTNNVNNSAKVEGLVIGNLQMLDKKDRPRVPRDRWKRLIDLGVFPAAYHAAVDWHRLEGIDEVIASYKDQMLNTITDLGHAFTVWCSFNEAIPYLNDDNRRLIAAERFAEFVAQQTYQDRSDYTKQDLPEIDKSDVLSAALKKPGFLGHNLITLGTLLRYEPQLEAREYKAGLYQTKKMLEHVSGKPYRDIVIEFGETIYEQSAHNEDLEQAVLILLRGGVDDVHTATMADASVMLWKHANEDQRKELLHYMNLLSQRRA